MDETGARILGPGIKESAGIISARSSISISSRTGSSMVHDDSKINKTYMLSLEEQRESARQWAEEQLKTKKIKGKKRPPPATITGSAGKKSRAPELEHDKAVAPAAAAPSQPIRQGPFSAVDEVSPVTATNTTGIVHSTGSPESGGSSRKQRASNAGEKESSSSTVSNRPASGEKKKTKKISSVDYNTSSGPSNAAFGVERRVPPLQVDSSRREPAAVGADAIPRDDLSPQDAALFSFQPSAVLPALPLGLVQLLGAWLCMCGASVFAFVVWTVTWDGNSLWGGRQLGLGARMDAAVAALDVIEHRLLRGEFGALWSLTDPNLRLLGMLYGAVVCACVGGLLINADPSAFHVPPLPERFQELMNLAMRQVSSINGIETGQAAVAATAPPPRLAISVSGMVLAVGRVIRWVLSWVLPWGKRGAEAGGRASVGVGVGAGAGAGTGGGVGPTDTRGATSKDVGGAQGTSQSAAFSSLLSSPRDQFNGLVSSLSSAREQGKQRLQTLTLWLSSRRTRSWTLVEWWDMGAGVAVVLAGLFWGLMKAGTMSDVNDGVLLEGVIWGM